MNSTRPDRLKLIRRQATVESLEERALMAVTSITVIAVNPTEATPFGTPGAPAPVALFTVNNFIGVDQSGQYSADIKWGDGAVSGGLAGPTIQFFQNLGGGNAIYEVFGYHTYTDATEIFKPIDLTVDVFDNTGPGTTQTGSTPISVNDVALAQFFLPPINATVGAPLTLVDVADFVDTNPYSQASDLHASVQFSSPSQQVPGIVVKDAFGVFHVLASHTYDATAAGTSPVNVSVSDEDPGVTLVMNNTATVNAAALQPNAAPLTVVEGTTTLPAGTVIGSFTDTGGAQPAANYMGIGTIVNLPGALNTPLTVTQNGSTNTYVLTLTSATTITALDEGVTSYTTRVSDTNGNTAVTTGSLTVTDAPLTLLSTNPVISPLAGLPFNNMPLMVFSDANLNATVSDFTARIDFGDGTPSSIGTVTPLGGGQFLVSGSHTYVKETAPGNTFQITINVADVGGQKVSGTTVAFAVTDAPIRPIGALDIFANENQALNDVTVGTFTDTNPNATAADFTATINFGDGSGNQPASVKLVGGSPAGAVFAVYGSHTYTKAGIYNTTFSVTDNGGAAPFTNAAGGVATISQSPILVVVQPLAATVDTPTTPGVIATFTDAVGTPDPAGSYTATIDWGDGSPTSVGTILPLGGNQFSVTAPAHTYNFVGTAVLKVTVNDSDPAVGIGGNLVIVSDSIIAANPPLGGPITGVVEGKPFTATVATLTDTDPLAIPTDYSATIDWGDGSPRSSGTIVVDPAFPIGTGHFLIQGTHTYADENPAGYTILTTVSDNFGGKSQTIAFVGAVADAALTAGVGVPVFSTENQPLNNVMVGTFVDANPLSDSGDFVVTINWGDGSITPGTATLVGGSAAGYIFGVYGSHDYLKANTYPITFSVTDVGGSTLINATGGPATVSQSPILVVALPISATVGAPTTPGVIATFTDAVGTPDPVGSYTATIDWGDGSASPGTIAPLGGNQYSVTAPAHTYTHTGVFVTRVTVNDSDPAVGIGGSVAIVNAATITLTPPVLQGPNNPATAVEGQDKTFVLGTFTSSNPLAVAGDFTVIVNFGDGTSGPGLVTPDPLLPGVFDITATHEFLDETPGAPAGATSIKVTVTDINGSTATIDLVVAVADAPLTAGTAIPVFAVEHQPLNNVPVGTFNDGNENATAADFAVLINWGDGTAATPGFATLVGGSLAGSTFSVSGSHVYAKAGTFTTTYSVVDEGGMTLALGTGGTATISQSPILVVVQPLTATVDMPTTPGVIATFTDTVSAPDPAGSYTATIDWGDGSPTSVGTIAPLGGNQFSVTAPAHTYNFVGTAVLKVTINDSDPAVGIGGNLVIVSDSIIATNPPLGGPIAGVVEGKPFTATVATLTDTDPLAIPTDYSATIDWGDGSPRSSGTIVVDPAFPIGTGHFLIQGTHTYTEENPAGHTILTTVSDNFGGKSQTTAFVGAVADATLVNPVTIPEFATDGQVLINAPLGTFADNNPLATASDFTATINWGDGTPVTPGFVTLVGGNLTQAIFSVSGTHVYTSPGVKTGTITVVDAGGSTVTIPLQVTVNSNPISLALTFPGPVTGTEGIPTAGGVIATFSDIPGDDPVTNYTVSINYGDGTPIDTTATVVNNGNGTYNIVAGPHTFPEEGVYPVTVSVIDSDSAGVPITPVVGVTLATVKDATLTGINGPAPINVNEGTPIGFQQLVTFIDANPLGTVSDFTATIDFGDGTTGTGTITQPFGPGTVFFVSGNHTYSEEGTFTGTVTITDVGGSKTTATFTVVVAEATVTLTPGGPLALTGVQNTELNLVDVATFTSSNPLDLASNFVATIYWGDLVGGVPTAKTAGTIVKDANGVFHVEGSHTYATAGTFPITVTIGEQGDPGIILDQTQSATATIHDNPLLLAAVPITATEGLAIPSAGTSVPGGTIVATFVDLGGADPIPNYTATIDWGDPTSPSTLGAGTVGIIVPLPGGGVNNQNYAILAPAGVTYLEAGNFTVKVTLVDNDPGGTASVFTANSANVLDATLSPAGVQPILTGTQGVPVALTLGSLPAGSGRTGLVAFTDANPGATVADFSATVDWGDGSPQSAGQVIANPAGPGFVVTGNHTFTNPSAQPFTLTVNVTDEDGKTLTLTNTIAVAASTITPGAAIVLNGVESQPLVNVLVATFTDSGLAGPISSYSAIINWGAPGSAPTFGQIVPLGGNTFGVLGTFTYPEESGPSSLPVPYTISVNISHNGTLATVATATALIKDAPVTGVAVPVFATEGAPFTGTVAIFQDTDLGTPADPTTNPADYTAVITWGDGTTSAGTITYNGGSFLVSGADPASGLGHTYKEQGSFPFSVTVTDQGGAFFTAFQTATVADAALTSVGVNTTTTEGPLPAVPLPGTTIPTFTVATFTDAGNSPTNTTPDVASDYTATINWGDGVVTSGTITVPSSGVGFQVAGQHLFKDEGTFQTTVTIKDDGGSTTTANGAITITDAALTAGTAAALTQVEGVPFTAQVGTFTDADLAAVIADYSATINWGDGTTSSAGIIGQLTTPVGSPSSFAITGSHTYAEESPTGTPYAITVSIKDINGGNTVTDTATATVLDAPLSSQGASIQGVEGLGLSPSLNAGADSSSTFGPVVVASFSDSDPLATVADFTAGTGSVIINWGDGSISPALPASAITAVGSPAGVVFTVTAPHTYLEEGNFQVTVTATDAGGAVTIAQGQANIKDAEILPFAIVGALQVPQVPATATEAQVFNGVVAKFTDTDPNGNPNDFYYTQIDWGDGSPRSTGTIINDPNFAPNTGHLAVVGSHTYADALVNGGTGVFNITASVGEDRGGPGTDIHNTINVTDVPISMAAQLNPASDTGKFRNDGITNNNQPNFFGVASQPNARVQLFATPAGGGAPVLIGQTTSLADGSFNVTSSRLLDGTYTITGTVTDATGHTVGTPFPVSVASNGGPNVLTIDTVAPRVTNADFNRFNSTVTLSFADSPGGSGLLLQSLQDSANYYFNNQLARPLGKYIVGAINVTPGFGTGEQTVTLSIINVNHGTPLNSRLLRGFFQIIARSASPANPSGIQDVAGNALDGEFYGPNSASGNGVPGGDFVANFNNFHNLHNPPATVIGFPHPNDPPAHFRRTTTRGNRAAQVTVPTTPVVQSSAATSTVINSFAVHDTALNGVTVPKKHRHH